MSNYMSSVKKLVDRYRFKPHSEIQTWRNSGRSSPNADTESGNDVLGRNGSRHSLTLFAATVKKRSLNDSIGGRRLEGSSGTETGSCTIRTSGYLDIGNNRLSDEVFVTETMFLTVSTAEKGVSVNSYCKRRCTPVISVTRYENIPKPCSNARATGNESAGAKMLLLAREVGHLPSISEKNQTINKNIPIEQMRTGPERAKISPKYRHTLSFSKSMPLSTPAENEEKRARRQGEIQLTMDTLRSELMMMQKMDEEIARKLLALYNDIRELKLKRSWLKHEELLDEAIYEAEKADELPDMCDAPRKHIHNLLSSHGVTSYNILSRRFSCS